MKKSIQILIASVILLSNNVLFAQITPSIEWQKCYGGTGDDFLSCVKPTSDGGFIIGATSGSMDGDVTGHNDCDDPNYCNDFWIMKIDSDGNLLWGKTLGGSDEDMLSSVYSTFDKGVIAVGRTRSSDGDVTGNHGVYDAWVVKLDSVGNLEWQKCLGGSEQDRATGVQQTTDGGYLIAASTSSNDGDVSDNHGTSDAWIIKLDADGNIVWQKCFGSSDYEEAYSIQETSDGGFVFSANAYSDGGDVSGNHGDGDYWIVKLDADGNLIWQKCLGGSWTEWFNYIKQTVDGGYIINGISLSNDFDVSGNHGGEWFGDYWVVKLDEDGNILWQKCLGGSKDEQASDVIQTNDGGFLVGGATYSNDGDVTENNSPLNSDGWIVMLDESGYLEWEICLGGSSADYVNAVLQNPSGRFIVGGTMSSNDTDVTGNHGGYDCWVAKLSTDISTSVNSHNKSPIRISPNPVRNLLTIDWGIQITDPIIRIYDLEGKTISISSTFKNNQAQLNTELLPGGVYTLQVVDRETGKLELGKFVKQ